MTNIKKVSTKIILILLLLVLSSCQGQDPQNSIRIYNWGEYIGEDVLDDFTKETGIQVIYETFASNEEMYSKIKSGGTYYDIIVPSDYMLDKMTNEGMLSPISTYDLAHYRNLDELFLETTPEVFSVPYMWGTVGILYNKTKIPTPISWDSLWEKDYNKEIFMYDSVRDSLGLALKALGYSLNTKNEAELKAAKNLLIEQFPLVQAYLGDGIKHKMIGEEGWLGVVYSGDAIYAMELNEDLDYVVPIEGSNIWYDGLAIPNNSKNKAGAIQFIDFMCREEIAARNTEYIGYSTVNEKALSLLPSEMVDNPIYWPSDETLINCEVFEDLGDFTQAYFLAWTEVLMQ